jgi:predicted nucleic acid-binding OB-fold protein
MNEICRQFPPSVLQYVCISIDYSQLTTTSRTNYIQVILKKVVNKNGWFLDKITGMYDRCRIRPYSLEIIHKIGDKCNYHVTNNDMAWNEYIKKGKVILSKR